MKFLADVWRGWVAEVEEFGNDLGHEIDFWSETAEAAWYGLCNTIADDMSDLGELLLEVFWR